MPTSQFIQPIFFPKYLFKPGTRYAINPPSAEVYCMLRLDDLGSMPPDLLGIALAKALKDVLLPTAWLTRIITMLEKNEVLFDEEQMQNYRINIVELKKLLAEMEGQAAWGFSAN